MTPKESFKLKFSFKFDSDEDIISFKPNGQKYSDGTKEISISKISKDV